MKWRPAHLLVVQMASAPLCCQKDLDATVLTVLVRVWAVLRVLVSVRSLFVLTPHGVCAPRVHAMLQTLATMESACPVWTQVKVRTVSGACWVARW